MEKNIDIQGLMKLETFQLSRRNMAEFLQTLTEPSEGEPLSIIERTRFVQEGQSIVIPEIFEKVIKSSQKGSIGFSINEIVSMGNHIEFTNLSSSAVQNWVKREMRELIGSPRNGKKYTVEQAAVLLIVEDLKASLDFESIRKILNLIFNNPDDRSDDIIDPVHFYAGYASIFEKLHHERIQLNQHHAPIHQEIEQFIFQEAQLLMKTFPNIREKEAKIVHNMIITAVHTVISAYYQDLTRKNLITALGQGDRSVVPFQS